MSDSELIVGIWRVASGESCGSVIPVSESMFGSKLLYTLSPDREPKEIDLKHRRPRDRPRHTVKGIYSLEGDSLKVCWGHSEHRPSTFAPDRRADQHLLILKRIQPEQSK